MKENIIKDDIYIHFGAGRRVDNSAGGVRMGMGQPDQSRQPRYIPQAHDFNHFSIPYPLNNINVFPLKTFPTEPNGNVNIIKLH